MGVMRFLFYSHFNTHTQRDPPPCKELFRCAHIDHPCENRLSWKSASFPIVIKQLDQHIFPINLEIITMITAWLDDSNLA